ncbi:hypothetical protein Bca4012_024742 [Brassica carinata]
MSSPPEIDYEIRVSPSPSLSPLGNRLRRRLSEMVERREEQYEKRKQSSRSGVGTGRPLVPALIIMGDSVVDVGNNNRLTTFIKANFSPYGRDFFAHNATGRFSNGKLATDFTAESLGFTSYPVAYLSQDANGTNLLTGANFASGASGFDDGTSLLYNLYSSGARRIGVTTLPPLGCLPAAITMFDGAGNNTCVERLNSNAVFFNTKLNNASMYPTNTGWPSGS